ncbi:MAG: alpha/beta fold hydrolase [Cyanobacteriota bacterium]|nr:alpha/beta fold hydrolase [Cyanobacteriota bacterium]
MLSVSSRHPRRCATAASLLVALAGVLGLPSRGAEVLEIQLDSLRLPISLAQLEAWSRQPARPGRRTAEPAALDGASDLAAWFALLDGQSQQELRQLLRAPLLRDQSFGRQLLDSWAGSQLLAEVGGLLTTPDGRSTTPLLQVTLRRLLEERREVSMLELLRALPTSRLQLQLDGLLSLAQQWRVQLKLQREALRQLVRLPALPTRTLSTPPPAAVAGSGPVRGPQRLSLLVPGRGEPLPLEIWTPRPAAPFGPQRPWLLVMPGLGGTAEQLGWLAAALAERGWPVVVLQHPGSDAAAVKATLNGLRPPPGAETLQPRLADLDAVLRAQSEGLLPLGARTDGVVLIGHSLGGVAALLGSGLAPETGLERRCKRSLDRLPITNPSLLLQCQLPAEALPVAARPPERLRGVVVFNSFGSLLWPQNGVRALPVPVLMVGGSLDLVTPPIAEQLDLFLPVGDDRSRLVLVEGGSHFSPVRVNGREAALLRLGAELVGASPEVVQALLLRLTEEFLESVEPPPAPGMAPQRLRLDGVSAHVMDRPAAAAWQERLRSALAGD